MLFQTPGYRYSCSSSFEQFSICPAVVFLNYVPHIVLRHPTACRQLHVLWGGRTDCASFHTSTLTSALLDAQVQELAWQRVRSLHDMPYARRMIGSWSLTEGRGAILHDHIGNHTMSCRPACIDARLGAVSIPSAHHTYSSVSKLVDCIPEQARNSSGPLWGCSTAPIEGELIMDFSCDSARAEDVTQTHAKVRLSLLVESI